MRAGVEEVFAFEINLRAAQHAREPFGKVKGRWPATKLFEVIIQLALKIRVVLRAEVFLLQFLKGVHQCLRHEPATVRAEVAARIRDLFRGN